MNVQSLNSAIDHSPNDEGLRINVKLKLQSVGVFKFNYRPENVHSSLIMKDLEVCVNQIRIYLAKVICDSVFFIIKGKIDGTKVKKSTQFSPKDVIDGRAIDKIFSIFRKYEYQNVERLEFFGEGIANWNKYALRKHNHINLTLPKWWEQQSVNTITNEEVKSHYGLDDLKK